MASKSIDIDMDRLRAAIRMQSREYVFFMLDEAIDLLEPDKLYGLVSKYLNMKELWSSPRASLQRGLLEEVEAFERASLAGEYYESFDVNWKNSTEMSNGTASWIGQCRRLFNRCKVMEKKCEATELCRAFEILFSLLDRIDECMDDIIFFADEGGSWEVNIDWVEILPSWFRALSATATPEEYGRKVTTVLDNHCSYEREEMLLIAGKTATPDQRKALDRIAKEKS